MGYRLRVTGYGLWVMGYGLPVMGYGLWVMGYGLPVTGKIALRDEFLNDFWRYTSKPQGYDYFF